MKTLISGNPIKSLALLLAGAAIGVYMGGIVLGPISADDDDEPTLVQQVTDETPRFILLDQGGNAAEFTLVENGVGAVLTLVEEVDDTSFVRDDDDD